MISPCLVPHLTEIFHQSAITQRATVGWWERKGKKGSEIVREGVREREMQFHPRLRQAIDGNSLQMKVISFHLLSIKEGQC